LHISRQKSVNYAVQTVLKAQCH